MSKSNIWEEFEKEYSKKLIKSAAKSDPDYNVFEETGEQLILQAHPETVEVAESYIDDGIIENQIQQHQVMVDVATRTPRGVLASSLLPLLSKIATYLDTEGSSQSIKLASEVDEFIEKIAQEKVDLTNLPVGDTVDTRSMLWAGGLTGAGAVGIAALLSAGPPGWLALSGAAALAATAAAISAVNKEVGDIYQAFTKAADYLDDLDFKGFFEFGGKTPQIEVEKDKLVSKLREFGEIDVRFAKNPEQLIRETYKAVSYIRTDEVQTIKNALIRESKDLGSDAREANVMWNRMAFMANEWLNKVGVKLLETGVIKPEQVASVIKPEQVMSVQKSQEQHKEEVKPEQLQSKEPEVRKTLKARPPGEPYNKSLNEEPVKELQNIIKPKGGSDGKFGHYTLDKLTEVAIKIPELDKIVKDYSATDFNKWDNFGIEEALDVLKKQPH